MKLFERICVGIVSASASFLMTQAAISIRAMQHSVADLAGAATSTTRDVNSLVQQTAAMEDQVYQAAQKISEQVARQNADWQKTQLQVYKAIVDMKTIVVRTDKSLNDVLVPHLKAALDSSANLTDTAALNLNHTMNELQPTFDSFSKAAAAAARTMNDPRIGETLGHVDDAAASTAKTADSTAQAAAHVEKSAGYIETFVQRETTPVRGVWNTFEWLLGLTAKGRQATGF